MPATSPLTAPTIAGTYLRGVLLLIALVAIGLVLDLAGLHGTITRSVYLACALGIMGAFAAREKQHRDRRA